MGDRRNNKGAGGRGDGIGIEDLRLWKAFTHDIEPLEEPDWQELENLIQGENHLAKENIRPKLSGKKNVPQIRSVQAAPAANLQPPQLDARTETRLRRGRLPIEGVLDLHGYRQDTAHHLLTNFVLSAHREGKRCLLIITGKGKSTAKGHIFDIPEGVLKQKVPQWLSLWPLSGIILKIVNATPSHGGSGALYVYLKRKRG